MGCCFLVRKAGTNCGAIEEELDEYKLSIIQTKRFHLSTILAATNKFSDCKKIGEGDYGRIYKASLGNGQSLAVKRLSNTTNEGATEFKNELVSAGYLHHMNIVKPSGFCLEGDEMILIYEYFPSSLENFLFDPEKRGLLDWATRYKIIGGIVKGIVYLHEDCPLRIIHGDLRPSVILLDENMNAKIAGFGFSRIFGVDQTQGNTDRITGTYGYVAPEYLKHGQFSVRSDIYAFGTLVLEIISGRRASKSFDFLSDVWKQWSNGTPLELMDPSLADSYSRTHVMRCIHIGLLCVQGDVDDRPCIASVVQMLNNYSVSLPLPGPPPVVNFKLTRQVKSIRICGR